MVGVNGQWTAFGQLYIWDVIMPLFEKMEQDNV